MLSHGFLQVFKSCAKTVPKCPKLFQRCLKAIPKLYQRCRNVVPNMSQRCRKVVSKLSQSCLKVVSKLSQSCTKDVSKLSQSCLKVALKMSLSCLKVVPKLSPSCFKAVPKLFQRCLKVVPKLRHFVWSFCLKNLIDEWGSDENYIWSSSIRRRGWKWRLDRAWWRASLWSRPFHHCSPGRSRVLETSKKYCNSPERASQNKLHTGTKGVGAWNDQFVNSWLEINFFTVTAWFALWTEVDLGQVASCHTWY